eukprot:1280879-Prymnesium_polylepis.1
MSTTILRGGTAHHAFACWRHTYGPAADRQRPSAPRPSPPAAAAEHRHGCLPKRPGSFRPPIPLDPLSWACGALPKLLR